MSRLYMKLIELETQNAASACVLFDNFKGFLSESKKYFILFFCIYYRTFICESKLKHETFRSQTEIIIEKSIILF